MVALHELRRVEQAAVDRTHAEHAIEVGPDAHRVELARLASPVFHVDRDDPPLLLLHGDQDPQMPINQAIELWGAYRKVAAPVQLEVVHGGVHGGELFYDDERLAIVRKFLERHFPNDRH